MDVGRSIEVEDSQEKKEEYTYVYVIYVHIYTYTRIHTRCARITRIARPRFYSIADADRSPSFSSSISSSIRATLRTIVFAGAQEMHSASTEARNGLISFQGEGGRA